MTFRPDFSLAVGTVSPEDWRAALVGLRVDLDAGALANACTLTVAVEQAPSVAAGDPVQVDLGGDGALSTVFTGTVDGLEPGLTELRIHTLDDGAKLLALRLDQGYERVSAGDIVRDLAGQAGVSLGQVDDGIRFPFYLVDGRRSAGQHVRALAARCGFESYCDQTGALVFRPFSRTLADHTFDYGDVVLAAEVFRADPEVGQITVMGESPSGSQGEDAWHWLAKDWSSYQGSAGSGGATLLVRDPSLRTQQAAQAAAEAVLGELQAGSIVGAVTVPGAPAVRLGDAIALSGTPGGQMADTFRVRQVRHRLTRRRGLTTRIGFTLLPAGGAPV